MIVSKIAYDLLNADKAGQKVLGQVNGILKILKDADIGGWTKKERDYPMVECSTFADDIKGRGMFY